MNNEQVAHIPGALFFDVDGISDRSTKVRGFLRDMHVRFLGNDTCHKKWSYCASALLYIRHYLFFWLHIMRKFTRFIGLSQLPHMLPSEEGFAAAVSALGIENKDGVVVYDGKGIFSAARVWW